MKFGIQASFTDQSPVGPAVAAAAIEAAGFESLFVADHTHYVPGGTTLMPGGEAATAHMARLLDPFIALTLAAAATTRLRVGTGVCLVAQRDPIVTAKQVATLDYISGGRFIFGVGAGYNERELLNHGVRPESRWRVMREHVRAMQAIWTQDSAAFTGEFLDFEGVASWPKPVQRPHPPVVVGGFGPNLVKRTLDYGDEMYPIARPGAVPIQQRIAELQQGAAAAGRGLIPVSMQVYGAPPPVELIRKLESAGVSRCVLTLGETGASFEAIERLGVFARGFA